MTRFRPIVYVGLLTSLLPVNSCGPKEEQAETSRASTAMTTRLLIGRIWKCTVLCTNVDSGTQYPLHISALGGASTNYRIRPVRLDIRPRHDDRNMLVHRMSNI